MPLLVGLFTVGSIIHFGGTHSYVQSPHAPLRLGIYRLSVPACPLPSAARHCSTVAVDVTTSWFTTVCRLAASRGLPSSRWMALATTRCGECLLLKVTMEMCHGMNWFAICSVGWMCTQFTGVDTVQMDEIYCEKEVLFLQLYAITIFQLLWWCACSASECIPS